MAVVAWDDAMGVGSSVLDSDHRILIDLLNQLHDATETGQSREVVGSVLGVLAEYVEHHFRREEVMMAAVGVPDIEAHRRQHHALEARVAALRDRYQAGERGALDEDVVMLLKRWLTEHIMVLDKSYRPWMEKAGPQAGTGKRGTIAVP
jgi:hemerythrin